MLVASRDRVPPFTRVPRRAPGAAAAPGRPGDSELHGKSGAGPAPAHPALPRPAPGAAGGGSSATETPGPALRSDRALRAAGERGGSGERRREFAW